MASKSKGLDGTDRRQLDQTYRFGHLVHRAALNGTYLTFYVLCVFYVESWSQDDTLGWKWAPQAADLLQLRIPTFLHMGCNLSSWQTARLLQGKTFSFQLNDILGSQVLQPDQVSETWSPPAATGAHLNLQLSSLPVFNLYIAVSCLSVIWALRQMITETQISIQRSSSWATN